MEAAGIQFEPGQQAHHITPCQLANHELVTTAGVDMNDAINGRALWGKNYQTEALSDGEPYHYFHTRYTARVEAMMDSEVARLKATNMLTQEEALTSWLNIIDFFSMEISQQGLANVLAGTSCLIE